MKVFRLQTFSIPKAAQSVLPNLLDAMQFANAVNAFRTFMIHCQYFVQYGDGKLKKQRKLSVFDEIKLTTSSSKLLLLLLIYFYISLRLFFDKAKMIACVRCRRWCCWAMRYIAVRCDNSSRVGRCQMFEVQNCVVWRSIE